MWKIFAALCCVLFAVSSDAAPRLAKFQLHGVTSNLGWHIFRGVGGGGGFLTGIDIATDGTKLVRTDEYGAYWWNSSATNCGNGAQVQNGCWQQVNLSTNGMISQGDQGGVFEIVSCHGNSNHWYEYWRSTLWVNTGGGNSISWSASTGFNSAQVSVGDFDTNANNGTARLLGQFMACDSANDNILVVGTPNIGAWLTTNGGTSFTQVQVPPGLGTSTATSSTATVTIATGAIPPFAVVSCASVGGGGNQTVVYETSDPRNAMIGTATCVGTTLTLTANYKWGSGSHSDWTVGVEPISPFQDNQFPTMVVFDPTSCGGGSCLTWYASAFNGVYRTTTGPAGTWSLLTGGGSGAPSHLYVDKFGNAFVSYGTNNAYECTACTSSGNWGAALNTNGGSPGGGTWAIVVDPASSSSGTSTVVAVTQSGGGSMSVSLDGGATWTGYNNSPTGRFYTANDIPWLGFAAGTFQSTGNIAYDPAQSHVLYWSNGVGVYAATPISSGVANWVSQTAGILELVSRTIISPPGGVPVFAGEDRGTYKSAGLDTYPSTHSCAGASSNDIVHAWGVDFAPGSVANMACNSQFSGTVDSGLSTDGGATFTNFAVQPGAGNDGGCIAITDSTHILYVREGTGPYLSQDGGGSWTQPTFTGISGGAGWPTIFFGNAQICARDTVTAGVFYLYNAGGLAGGADSIWTLTNGGTATKQCQNCNSGSNFDGAVDTTHPILQAMPGIAGELLFSLAAASNSSPGNSALYKSTDSGVTWAAVSLVSNVTAFGTGKGSGSTAAIYFLGKYNGVQGYWVSNDNASTWTKISDQYPLGVMSNVQAIVGDGNTYGLLYSCTEGMQCFYNRFQ